MTQQTASNSDSTTAASSGRNSWRAGLAVFAVLGLPLSATLAPGTAAAAPGDSFDDIDMVLPIDELPVLPMLPAPVPPIAIPFPVGPSVPSGVPGPDDGPGLPFDLPELNDPFDLVPFDPSDFVLPTGPGDDDDPADDDDAEPECAEYAAANFDIDVERYAADRIEVKLMYADMDVCDFTVWTAIAAPGAADTLGETTVGMETIAFATDSAGYYQQTFSDHDLCDLEIRFAVEESLPVALPYSDPGCDTPDDGDDTPEAEIPGDEGDDTPDDGDDAPDDGDDAPDDGDDAPDDGDDTPDDGDDTPDDGDDAPDDGGDTPEQARPLGQPETPQTPSGGLPQTGTDLTTVMLALGLMTVGAGSIVALATRRREELPTA